MTTGRYQRIRFTFDGKRYAVYGKTPGEVLEKKFAKIDELKKGRAAYDKRKKDITFEEYAKTWLPLYNSRLQDSTRKDIEARLKNYINPHIGNLRMKDITRSDLTALFESMAGMSTDRIAKARQTLRKVLECAYEDGYIARVPNLKTMDVPRGKEADPRRPVTPYERKLTLEVAKYHRAGPWVLTMLYCGLRPQECAALQGRHINFKTNQITVEQALKRDGAIDTTKSRAGRRAVPIPPPLLPYLPKVEPFAYVFTSATGNQLTHKTLHIMWRSFKREMNIAAGCPVYRNALVPCMESVKDCGHGCMRLLQDYIRDGIGRREFPIMDDLVPYVYRHTFCTDAVTAGVPLELLKELAGHSSISVTAKFYIHQTPERLNQAAELMANYHAITDKKAVKQID